MPKLPSDFADGQSKKAVRCTLEIRKLPLESFRHPDHAGRKWRDHARRLRGLILELSTYADPDGPLGKYSPSIETLQKQASRATLYRLLDDLRDLGFLTWTRESHYFRRQYTISIPENQVSDSNDNRSQIREESNENQVSDSVEQVSGSTKTGLRFANNRSHSYEHHPSLPSLPSLPSFEPDDDDDFVASSEKPSRLVSRACSARENGAHAPQRVFLSQNQEPKPEIRAWARSRILARGQTHGPILDPDAYVRKAEAKFLAELDNEIELWLVEVAEKQLDHAMQVTKAENPDATAIVEWQPIFEFLAGECHKYRLPYNADVLTRAVRTASDNLGADEVKTDLL